MDPLTVMAAIMVGSTVMQGFSQYGAEQGKLSELKLQSKEQQLEYQEKALNNLDAVQNMLDAQVAWQSVSGAAMSSPTFNAIQRNTVNMGARRQRNLALEEDIVQANIRNEKKNVKDTLFSQLFGDTLSLASAGANIASKMPSFGG